MSAIARFVKDYQMVTTDKNGAKTIRSEAEALVWISEHVHTAMHAESVMAGIPTKMVDGSEVIFEEKN